MCWRETGTMATAVKFMCSRRGSKHALQLHVVVILSAHRPRSPTAHARLSVSGSCPACRTCACGLQTGHLSQWRMCSMRRVLTTSNQHVSCAAGCCASCACAKHAKRRCQQPSPWSKLRGAVSRNRPAAALPFSLMQADRSAQARKSRNGGDDRKESRVGEAGRRPPCPVAMIPGMQEGGSRIQGARKLPQPDTSPAGRRPPCPAAAPGSAVDMCRQEGAGPRQAGPGGGGMTHLGGSPAGRRPPCPAAAPRPQMQEGGSGAHGAEA